MKSRKNTILIMLLGLLLVAFAAAMGQTPTQGDQNQKSEACCAMESCCGNDGSCPMKAEGATNADAKEGCCCKGDSCDMKQDGKDHPDCCADSCDMTKHDGKHEGKDCCKAKAKTKQKSA